MNEREIFAATLEVQDERERAAFLDQACEGNQALRQRIQRLLQAHIKEDSLLDSPTGLIGTDTDHPDKEEGYPYLTPSQRPGALGRLGHYDVLEVLGRGGFGTVFRGFDEKLNRVVAVKVLSPLLAINSPARKRFLREARSAAAIRHENVVHVYAVEEQPLPYLVMEFVPGETLQQRIDRIGPLEVAEVVSIGRQIAAGLAAAHDSGVVHRDVKPANVLIERGPHPRVKLTDFGLARAADDASITGSGLVAGTPMFMSPEQAKGETLDHRSDLFSLGSVLYCMVAGRSPFRAANSMAVLKRVTEETPRPLTEIIPETPKQLCEIIARLHAKEPAKRYQRTQDVVDVLARVVPGEPGALATGVPSQTPVAHAPGSPWRWRVFVAAAGILLLVAGLGFSEGLGVTNLRSTVVRLFSPEGTLIVESDDPDVSITIDGEDVVITGAGVKELRVKPGQYKVQASKDGKVVSQQLATVTKNGKEVVKVTREIPAPPKDPPGDPKPERRAALWLRSLGKIRIDVLDEQGRSHVIQSDQPLPDFPFRFDHVFLDSPAVEEMGDTLADEMAKHLEGTQVRAFNITSRKLTTEGLGKLLALPECSNLEALWFNSLDIDDRHWALLARLEKLTSIDYCDLARVTGKGIGALKACPQFGSMTFIGETPITPEALVEMRALPKFERLNCTNERWTPRHSVAVAELKLGSLDLGNSGIDDTAAARLAKMTTLKSLVIPANPLTDKGLAHFASLKALEHLDVGNTQVTAEGIAALRKALPNCKIVGP